jgi:hypothetical protein
LPVQDHVARAGSERLTAHITIIIGESRIDSIGGEAGTAFVPAVEARMIIVDGIVVIPGIGVVIADRTPIFPKQLIRRSALRRFRDHARILDHAPIMTHVVIAVFLVRRSELTLDLARSSDVVLALPHVVSPRVIETLLASA